MKYIRRNLRAVRRRDRNGHMRTVYVKKSKRCKTSRSLFGAQKTAKERLARLAKKRQADKEFASRQMSDLGAIEQGRGLPSVGRSSRRMTRVKVPKRLTFRQLTSVGGAGGGGGPSRPSRRSSPPSDLAEKRKQIAREKKQREKDEKALRKLLRQQEKEKRKEEIRKQMLGEKVSKAVKGIKPYYERYVDPLHEVSGIPSWGDRGGENVKYFEMDSGSLFGFSKGNWVNRGKKSSRTKKNRLKAVRRRDRNGHMRTVYIKR